jgi:hypothetical protein
VIEAGFGKRNQPAPPHVVFESLTQPGRDPCRPWLLVLDDERAPQLLRVDHPSLVTLIGTLAQEHRVAIRVVVPGHYPHGASVQPAAATDAPEPDSNAWTDAPNLAPDGFLDGEVPSATGRP